MAALVVAVASVLVGVVVMVVVSEAVVVVADVGVAEGFVMAVYIVLAAETVAAFVVEQVQTSCFQLCVQSQVY